MTPDLSPREDQVLRALVRGKSYKETAQELGVQVTTVRTRAHHVHEKLGVTHRGALLHAWQREMAPAAAVLLHGQWNSLSEETWRDVVLKVLDALDEA